MFSKDGGPLTAKAVFLGDLIADYGMFLKEKDSNLQTELLHGDNTNAEDDSSQLPTPCIINHGRKVKLETIFVGNHPDINKDYEIRLEIWQDDLIVGVDIDKSTEQHFLNGKAQPSLLLITLIAQ